MRSAGLRTSVMCLCVHVCAVVDEWTMEDKVIFEQAYQKYGKNFQRIKSMVSQLTASAMHTNYSVRGVESPMAEASCCTYIDREYIQHALHNFFGYFP